MAAAAERASEIIISEGRWPRLPVARSPVVGSSRGHNDPIAKFTLHVAGNDADPKTTKTPGVPSFLLDSLDALAVLASGSPSFPVENGHIQPEGIHLIRVIEKLGASCAARVKMIHVRPGAGTRLLKDLKVTCAYLPSDRLPSFTRKCLAIK